MAYPVVLDGRTYTLADFEGLNYVDGFPDALESFVTHAANVYTSTSTSSVEIGTGSKTFTIADTGKPYLAGTPLRIAATSDPSNQFMDGVVTSYAGSSLTIDVKNITGSGTYASWNVTIGGGTALFNLPAITASSAELNILDGVTASSAELNILDGVTATTAELNYLDITTLGTSQASKAVTADANGNVILAEEVQATAYIETVVALSGTTPTVDCDEGNSFTLTTSGDTTFTFDYSGVNLTTNDSYGFTLKVTAGGTHTLTWPASVDWPGGTAPDAPASGETDVYVFYTVDGGTNWYGFQAGDALA